MKTNLVLAVIVLLGLALGALSVVIYQISSNTEFSRKANTAPSVRP